MDKLCGPSGPLKRERVVGKTALFGCRNGKSERVNITINLHIFIRLTVIDGCDNLFLYVNADDSHLLKRRW